MTMKPAKLEKLEKTFVFSIEAVQYLEALKLSLRSFHAGGNGSSYVVDGRFGWLALPQNTHHLKLPIVQNINDLILQ